MERLRVVCVVLVLACCALAQRRVAPAGGCTTVDNTVLSGDVNPASDTVGWRARAPMPTLPSGKRVRAGGWLAYDGSIKLVYGAKGNRTGDFYAYFASGDSWHPRAPIPSGLEGKLPYDGAAGFSDGNGVLYATKGNNTVGFWAYDAALNTWTQKANVPRGPSGKKVKGGTDLVVASSGGAKYVYLLKGYMNEFYRYDPRTNTWTQLLNAPIGAGGHVKWGDGSWLAYCDLQNKIYAHKAKYNELYSFNTEADTWDTTHLSGMPMTGSSGRPKKSKDGGCATYHDSAIYALKGGNTQEFWKYNPFKDTGVPWLELETIPKGYPRKKVGSGADITAIPKTTYMPTQPAELPALTGNNSSSSWSYHTSGGASPPLGPALERNGVAAEPRHMDETFFALSPNPLSGAYATLRYSLPGSGTAVTRVYDVSGWPVLTVTLSAGRTGAGQLDLSRLKSGVYVLKVDGAGFTTVRKLVVQR